MLHSGDQETNIYIIFSAFTPRSVLAQNVNAVDGTAN